MKTSNFYKEFGKQEAMDLVRLSLANNHDFESVKPFYQSRFRQHILDFITENFEWSDFIKEITQYSNSLLFIECFGGYAAIKKAKNRIKKRKNKNLFRYLKQVERDYKILNITLGEAV